jgi:putative acetyltransferase
MSITIRNYLSSDATALTEIFYAAVRGLTDALYTRDQIEAWAPLPKEDAAWQARLERLRPFVAEVDGRPVAFMSLEADGHIDLAYTHSDHQGAGIATALYAHLAQAAIERKISTLRVEASHHARPFFLKRNFSILKRNEIHRNGCTLVNWTMVKPLVR